MFGIQESDLRKYFVHPKKMELKETLDRYGWTSTHLGNITTYNKGYAFSSSEFTPYGVPVVKVSNFTDRSINITNCDFINEKKAEKYEKYRLFYNDVIIATVGSGLNNQNSIVGNVIRVPQEADGALLNQNAVVLRANTLVDQKFLFYLLKDKKFQTFLLGGLQGSANQASITLKSIFSFEFLLPPLDRQTAISHILGILDDKIELNRRMNATLEAMARALFRSWFVDFDPVRAKAEGREPAGMDAATAALFPDEFEESELGEIPKGWSVGSLRDIASNPRRGIQPGAVSGDTHYIGLEHMPRRSVGIGDWGCAADIQSNKFAFKEGEFLFGKLRPYFHKVGIAPIDGVCSTDILVVAPQKDIWSSFVLMTISSDEFVDYTSSASTGTKMPRTSWEMMIGYPIVLPPADIMSSYETSVHHGITRITQNIHESRTLAALRDTLLPKLISGEIRVIGGESAIETLP